MDRALGLDWKALLDWMNGWPVLFDVLRPIYLCLTLQMTAVVLCLAFTGRLVWLRVFTLAFMFAALITIAMSAVLPAAGVWPYYALTAADSAHVVPTVSTSWPVFYGLRDGSVRALVAAGAEGIITFPSLHAALAVIVIVALWPIAKLRWPILVLNSAMLAATPVDGSHYFVDVFAGIAVAAIALLAARAVAAWVEARSDRAAARMRAGKMPQLAGGQR
jgi:PAP2 superfamily